MKFDFINKIILRAKLYCKYKTIKTRSFNTHDISGKKIFIFLAADYGNLGDVAITYAQTKLLKDLYPLYEIVDVPISKTLFYLDYYKKISTKEDIITITGGGNMGDLYDDIEFLRQLVVREFPNNKIIVFPQTIDFSKSFYGKISLNWAKKVYNKHKDLILLAREEISYKLMKDNFPNALVYLTPDIVMTLNKTDFSKENRHGITLCLRNDQEIKIPLDFKEKLKDFLSSKYKELPNITDTHINKANLSLQERELELYKIWNVLGKSKLVVTDRLHGMIFCYITKTPVIVLPNNNHKITSCFEWIKDCGYVFLMNSFSLDEIMKTIEKIYYSDSCANTLNNRKFVDIFNNLLN